MAGDEPDVRRKHHRSPDDGAEGDSKRRKHSHHRSSHRHHRHHRHRSSKHHNESKHEEEDLPSVTSPPPLPAAAVGLGSNSLVNYDKEEGEILEEEDCIVGNSELSKKRVDSDIESGEIKPDEVVEKLDNQNQGVNVDGDSFSGKAPEEIEVNLNLLPKDKDIIKNSLVDVSEKPDYRLRECSDGIDINKINDVADVPMDSIENVMSESKEHDLGEFDASSARLETVEYGEKERWHGDSSHEDRTLSLVNGDVGHKSREVGARAHKGYEFPQRDTEKEKRGRDDEAVILRRRDRSRTPLAKEDLDLRKHRKLDGHGVKTDRSRDAEEGNMKRYVSRRPSESTDTEKGGLKIWNKSVSPESTEDKYKTFPYSSTHEGYESHMRNRSGSRDHVRERRSRSRSVFQDGEIYYYEMNVKSDSREKARNEPDSLGVVRDSREGRHGARDLARNRERERSSSYSRHNPREDRHGSRDIREKEREREKDRGRERDRNKDRERNRDRERDRNRENEVGKERGRDGYKDYRRPKHESDHHWNRSRDAAKESSFANADLKVGEERQKRDEDDQEDYEEKVALKLAEQEEEDIDKIKEESRRRREAILEKYKQQQLPKHVGPHSEDPQKAAFSQYPFLLPEEKIFLTVDKSVEQSSPKAAANVVPDGPDSRNDGSDVDVAGPLFSVGKSPQQNGSSSLKRTSGVGGLGDGTPKSERSTDMFCDDIFGESPAGVRKMGKGDGLLVERSGLNDNWDDAEGYYSYRFGEVLDGRYEVIAAHGKGVFSTVVRAKDLKAGKGDPEEVAIKIIRNNDTMYKAGLEELVILKKLVGADPEDRRHCVRFLSTFKYRNHLCLVFESLHMNLREVLKKFGRNIGLKLTAVRAYAKQLFIALKHLRNCGVLHCDIKPDNMLVNEAKNVLKLCDFGNAMFAGKNEITPYLVSRFYRAPEIILGLTYDHPLDIWSVGCCLYELYSGKVLFPGPSNNDMLRLHMELKGPFPKKMLRKGAFTDQHFDQDLNFHATEEDPVTKKAIKRLLLNIKPKDIGTIVTSSPGEDPKMLANFKDLLEKIFVLDPEKRMTVSQALSHPFITGK